MEFNELLEKRRSVRKYKANTTVDRETIEEIIKAAQQAPTWKNSQTGRYYVVTDEEKLKEIKENCLLSRNGINAENAPVLIVTTFVKDWSGFEKNGSPTNEAGNLWGAYDLGLQNQNLMMKASDLGLDTLVMGVRDEMATRNALDIPSNEKIEQCIVTKETVLDNQEPRIIENPNKVKKVRSERIAVEQKETA